MAQPRTAWQAQPVARDPIRRLTAQDIARIREAWGRNENTQRVVDETGFAYETVCKYRPAPTQVRKHWITPPERIAEIEAAWRKFGVMAEVCRQLGCSQSTARKYRPADVAAPQHKAPLTPERIEAVKAAWREHGTMSKVAKACGVGCEAALRYKPADIEHVQKKRISVERRQLIADLWREHGRLNVVTRLAKCCEHTALTYRPADCIDKTRHVGAQGYSTWSQETRDRWDAFWAGPTQAERLATLLGWNDGFYATKRGVWNG